MTIETFPLFVFTPLWKARGERKQA